MTQLVLEPLATNVPKTDKAQELFDDLITRKVADDELEHSMRAWWQQYPTEHLLTCINILDKRSKTVGEKQLEASTRILGRTLQFSGKPLHEWNKEDCASFAAVKQWQSLLGRTHSWVGATKRRDLRVLIELIAIATRLNNPRIDFKDAKQLARALVTVNGKIPKDGSESKKRDFGRLLRAERDEWIRFVERDDGSYLAAVWEFLIKLIDDTGGRFTGAFTRAFIDIRWAGDEPAFIRCGYGFRNKRRSMWRLDRAKAALIKVLQRHPQRLPGTSDHDYSHLLDPTTYLTVDIEAAAKGTYKPMGGSSRRAMWKHYQKALTLDVTAGPKAFRRFANTRKAVSGDHPDQIMRGMAHNDQKSRKPYVHMDREDSEEIGERTGWAPRETATYCEECNLRASTYATTCTRCGKALPNQAAPELLAKTAYWQHEAWHRYGLSVYDTMLALGEDASD